MTKTVLLTRRNKASWFSVTLLAVLLLFFYSDQISESIRLGIKISVVSVIPSVFPFLILAEYLSSQISINSHGSLLSKLFSIPKGSDGALICGIICGFPCGVKYARRLYDGKIIDKKDFERLIGLINNPSLAFVISGVGMGMLKSLKDGIILYSSIIASIFIVSKVFAQKATKIQNNENISEQSFNLTLSIKNAGLSSITISSYIIFFSALLGIIKKLTNSIIILPFAAALLEIGNATTLITAMDLNDYYAFILYGFSLGFSGFSVHLQALEILPAEISRKQYFKMKALQGILCGIIALLLKGFVSLF